MDTSSISKVSNLFTNLFHIHIWIKVLGFLLYTDLFLTCIIPYNSITRNNENSLDYINLPFLILYVLGVIFTVLFFEILIGIICFFATKKHLLQKDQKAV
jgi:hypothetical protein